MLVDKVSKNVKRVTKQCNSMIEEIDEIWMPAATEKEEKDMLESVVNFLTDIELLLC